MKAPVLCVAVLCAAVSAVHSFQVPLRAPAARARLGASRFAGAQHCATPTLARRRDVLTLRMNQQQEAQDELIRKLADVDPLNLPSAASQVPHTRSTKALLYPSHAASTYRPSYHLSTVPSMMTHAAFESEHKGSIDSGVFHAHRHAE